MDNKYTEYINHPHTVSNEVLDVIAPKSYEEIKNEITPEIEKLLEENDRILNKKVINLL